MSTAHAFAALVSDADRHAVLAGGSSTAPSTARTRLMVTPAGTLAWTPQAQLSRRLDARAMVAALAGLSAGTAPLSEWEARA